MDFFETSFADIANSPLGKRSQTFRRALQRAYTTNGIDEPAADDAEPPDRTADATSEHLRESLVRLRAKLNELEAENECLRAELAAERERDEESESTQSDDDGFLSGLFG